MADGLKGLAAALLLAVAGVAVGQTQELCFANGGLRDEDRVYLTINGSQVEGRYVILREYDAQKTESHAFVGTKTGNALTVRFAPGKMPEGLPQSNDNHGWALHTVSGKAALNIRRYGKNYNTQQFSTYDAVHELCSDGSR